MDHWPALPSPSLGAPGRHWAAGKSSKVDWGAGVEGGGKGEEPQGDESEESEGDLQHLMKSLDIAEHLHVLQVHMIVSPIFRRIVWPVVSFV